MSAMKLYDLIRSDSSLSFLPPEGVRIFDGCFDLTLRELPPGARFDTAGRLAYLLRGSGEVGAWDMESGTFFGLDAAGMPERQVFTAHTRCLLLLWDDAVLTGVCYGACWFHARLIEEAKRSTGKRTYRIGE